ncbi:MAG: beta-ketoacyl-[acyl-carrier-protein] synthase family protein [Planctomycetes bacterium]|nr:beta-ketoacyl-[acyl-carrier-protein] synthase family protein [Planctomycetota bacterium]
MPDDRRAVVTGLGVVCALGVTESAFWESLLAGRSGIGPVTRFDAAGYRTRVASEIDDAALGPALKARKIRPTDRSVDIGLLAAAQALESAGLASPDRAPEPQEVTTIFGTGAGPSDSAFAGTRSFLERGLAGLRPSTVPTVMINAVSAQISLRYKLRGPNWVVASACASSTAAIGQAFRLVRAGHAERVLAGGTDAILNPLAFGAWNNLGVMSANPDPDTACRPFDVDRDGLVLGEGAAALVVESLAAARARSAAIRAEILGFGESSDAEHITRPDPDGQARAIAAALASAGLRPADVGFINAHGSATPANDTCESDAIRRVFGAAADRIPTASSKSYFGHTLGACGALETAATLLALAHGLVPGNRNLHHPDPQCAIRLVGRAPEAVSARVAIKNSFGFGGHNAVLVLGRFED